MKERLIRINSVASSSEDNTDNIELRARGGGRQTSNYGQTRDNESPTWLGNRVLIDRQIMPGDTLNKIALQYSVQVCLPILFYEILITIITGIRFETCQ